MVKSILTLLATKFMGAEIKMAEIKMAEIKMAKIKIVEVKTRKQKREFVNLPNELYADNPNYVPKLYSDEMQIFKPNYVYNQTCESVFYNAYKNNKIAGRIQGILQKKSNEIRNEKRVRFTRFDTINDISVAKKLLDAVEQWAKSKGMDVVFGPLGYSDLEPEGVLVEGFDQLSTFFETYNAQYYKDLIEQCGYVKEVDWVEHQIWLSNQKQASINKMYKYLAKHSKFKLVQGKNVYKSIKKYGDIFLHLIDVSYKELYQTVPIPEYVGKKLISGAKFIINPKYFGVVVNEKDEHVGFGLCFPSIVEPVKKSKGHLYPRTVIQILKNVKKPTGLEMGLVGIKPEYRNTEACALMMSHLFLNMKADGIEFAETNLNLETNEQILSLWKHFEYKQHKRRRCYIKKI